MTGNKGSKAKAVADATPAASVFGCLADVQKAADKVNKLYSGLSVVPKRVRGKFILQVELSEVAYI